VERLAPTSRGTPDVDPEAREQPRRDHPHLRDALWDKLDKKTELPKLRQMATSYLLSNFLHGEQGALLATAQIVGAVPSADAKLYAATQVMDEARHVEAYDRYLREKVEMTFPISPHLRTLLDEILRESRWDMKYLGMQIMVEGLALAAFGFISQIAGAAAPQIVHMIMQDEARHVAFGVLSLKGIYEDMSESELRDREDLHHRRVAPDARSLPDAGGVGAHGDARRRVRRAHAAERVACRCSDAAVLEDRPQHQAPRPAHARGAKRVSRSSACSTSRAGMPPP
jgi:hypothetical protein